MFEPSLFPQNTAYWKVNRETLVALAAPRAVLMEIAHPLVAEGVARHSDFRRRGLRRLYRTAIAAARVTFGTEAQARKAAARIAHRHKPVTGTLPQDDGVYGAGRPYSASDPDLMFWVLATLIDTSLRSYEFLVSPLSQAEKQEYYGESLRLAGLLRIPSSAVCPQYSDFTTYMSTMLGNDALHIGATALALKEELFPPNARGRLIYAASFFGIGLLPERLREAYGFPWNDRKQRRLENLARRFRKWRPRLPDFAAVSPFATVSEWKARAGLL